MQPVTGPKQRLDLDGYGEFTFGLLMLSISVPQGIALVSPKGSIGSHAFLLFFVFTLAINWWRRAHQLANTHISSHIEPDTKASAMPLLLMACWAPIIAWLKYPNSFDWAAAHVGLSIVAIHWYGTARYVYWKSIIALVLAMSTIVVSALPFTDTHTAGHTLRFACTTGLVGILISLSGGITFWRVRRSHPQQTLVSK